jgi:hypothetical protein
MTLFLASIQRLMAKSVNRVIKAEEAETGGDRTGIRGGRVFNKRLPRT